MVVRRDPKPIPYQEPILNSHNIIIIKDFEMHDEWDQEADRMIDESELRRKPDWLEAIGDEDDTEPIEINIRENWALRGEDDYVSDPTSEADMPTWVDDDYDDESHT